MKSITIDKFSIITDLPKITQWDNDYKKDPRFESIRRYILEDNIFYNLAEVVAINYEKYPIGNNERKHIFAVNNEKNKLIAFMITHVFDIQTTEPNMLLQYIVIHPEHQHEGYGKLILKEFLANLPTYIGVNPIEVFTHIETTNLPSQKLFADFGFSWRPSDNPNYLQAYKIIPTLNEEKI